MSEGLMATPLLAAKGLTVSFGGVDVVRSVDVEFFSGEIHALAGENGAGKSSLAKALAGVYHPSAGAILLDGGTVAFSSPREALSRGIALIHQEPHLFPDLSVAENIFAGHLPRHGLWVSHREAQDRATSLLIELGVELDPLCSAERLSIAQQQRVELASALTHNARVWIFDETTAPLTPAESEDLFRVMRVLKEQGCAIVIVTHHLQDIISIADKVTVLRDGAKVSERFSKKTSIPELVRDMVGRDLAEAADTGSSLRADSAAILEVRELSGPGFVDVSFDVRPGEVVGLAGLVGSGRTELLRVLFGIERRSRGEITLLSKDYDPKSPSTAIEKGVALVPEDRRQHGLLGPLSIEFNAVLAALTGKLKAHRRLTEIATEAVGKVHLKYSRIDQSAETLSGGNQQKVVLAKWLLTEPKLLLLDEPTRGVDIAAKHEVHQLIRNQAVSGRGVLLASSDLPEVLALSDRILVMREGRIVKEFAGQATTQDEIMLAAAGGKW